MVLQKAQSRVEQLIAGNVSSNWTYLIVKNNKNVGVTVAWNQGLSIAVREHKSDYVMVCNSDIYFGYKVLRHCIDSMDRNGLYSISPDTYPFSGKGLPSNFLDQSEKVSCGSTEDIVNVSKFIGWCFILSKECLNKVGWIDPRFDLWRGDKDYGERILKAGQKINVLKNCSIYHFLSCALDKLPTDVKHTKIKTDELLYNLKWGTNERVI